MFYKLNLKIRIFMSTQYLWRNERKIVKNNTHLQQTMRSIKTIYSYIYIFYDFALITYMMFYDGI